MSQWEVLWDSEDGEARNKPTYGVMEHREFFKASRVQLKESGGFVVVNLFALLCMSESHEQSNELASRRAAAPRVRKV